MLAAVVVGVDKVGGGLPKLKAAASGAEEVAGWLRRSDYKVDLLTDRNGRVERKAIFQAVTTFVETGAVERLVIYFGGHGFLNGPGDEFWVLSDAPLDASEAVNVSLSQHAARYLGIPEVVFISDACRVRAHTAVLGSIKGASIFPNVKPNQNSTEIDFYYGTWPGDPALERDSVEAEGAHGLFSQELLQAHKSAPPEAILKVGEREFVRSRWLKKILLDRVDARAAAIALRLTQRPDIQIQTYDSYIAEHEPAGEVDEAVDIFDLGLESMGAINADEHEPSAVYMKGIRQPKVADETSSDDSRSSPRERRRPAPIRRRGSDSGDIRKKGLEAPPFLREAAFTSPAFISRVDLLRRADPPGAAPFWTGSGVSLACSGDVLSDIAFGPEIDEWIRFDTGATVAFDVRRLSSQVAIRFNDGTGMLLPMLPDYNVEIVRQEGRTLLVGYTWVHFRDPRLVDLRAQVMGAATLGMLDRTKAAARSLATRIRKAKKFDPALGLVASLAYMLAGDQKGAASVRRYMREDLNVDLFDSWLLGGAGDDDRPISPALPLLSQTWSFLDLYDAPLPEAAKNLRRVPGFWTVFESDAMDTIMQLVSDGSGLTGGSDV